MLAVISDCEYVVHDKVKQNFTLALFEEMNT